MTKIEEIIESNFGLTNSEENVDLYCNARNTMVEYAEYYARKVLEIAAEKANVIDVCWPEAGECEVDKESILNIKLPEHE